MKNSAGKAQTVVHPPLLSATITRRSVAFSLGCLLTAPVLAKARIDTVPDRASDVHTTGDAIQRRIDALAALPNPGGTLRFDSEVIAIRHSIDLRTNVELSFGRCAVYLRPAGSYAFGIGWDEKSPMVGPITISGRGFQLWGDGKTAIAVRNGSGAQLVSADIDLKSRDQIGLLVRANDNPMGPYYGLVDNVRINGVGAPGQRGIVLEGKPVNGSITVNRWNFNNIRHLASVEIGLDAQGVDGATFHGVNFESCHGRAARFGYGNRTVSGTIDQAGSAGTFGSRALVGSGVDPSGAVKILTGPNAGESMIVTAADTSNGAVLFPMSFPYKFIKGDRFVFTECKCRSITMLNVTNEGGAQEGEVGFEFLAGARSCRVEVAMMTMAQGKYFTREIEDESNTIARTTRSVIYTADLDPMSGDLWLPQGYAGPGIGGEMTHGPCWVDAVYASAQNGSGGFIEIEAFANERSQGLVATLTPDSPYTARRVRTELKANGMLNIGTLIKVRVRMKDMQRPERIRVEVVLAYL